MVAGIAGAGIAGALEAPPGDPEVVELLSGMSYVPDQGSIDSVLGSAAVDELIAIAEDSSATADPGLRIRAFGALGQYGGSKDEAAASFALRSAINKFAALGRGTEVLYLRASMLSLSQLESGTGSAVPTLVPLLSHSLRDIRAACAQALGITMSQDAVLPLRQRAQVEEEDQVLIAIEDALFQLASGN